MRNATLLILTLALLSGCRTQPSSSDLVCLAQAPPPRLYSGATLKINGPFLVEHGEYTVCYDGQTKNPIWVYERLSRESLEGPNNRKEAFRPDPDLPSHVCSCLTDYRGSGFDRGHLAAAANHKSSDRALDETFYLSNISPQVSKGFNRSGGLWYELEAHVREVVRKEGRAHVISGPLYLPQKLSDGSRGVSYKVLGKNSVAVPTHFFKILYAETSRGMGKGQAWILPNRAAEGSETYTSFAVSVDEALRAAGLEVHPRSHDGKK